ncbi:hypothetical protein BCD67_20170 [Oscillatoriales cyanobacterium USR001]|nr:hypothetical protein BCD67_20170 [Oscillatoriales cyanobacterium USR001]
MSATSKYWTLVKINIAGGCKIEVITEAKVFFTSEFLKDSTQTDISDDQIQRHLQELMKFPPPNQPEKSLLAKCCLLCFISHHIQQVCRHIEAQFGTVHGFTYQDLLPFVLSEDGRFNKFSREVNSSSSYQSISQIILESFDPDRSSLTTWIYRRVKHNSELNSFLLERGVYLVSDWAILNDTRPKQLERILSEFYQLTPFEVQQSIQILESYHAIYRAARMQQRQAGARRQCQPPTPEQLQQIAQNIEEKTSQKISAKMVMSLLQQLASRLRNYRISVRGGSPQTEILDTSENSYIIKKIVDDRELNDPENQEEKNEFLKLYRQQLLVCLEAAIAEVIAIWIKQLQRQSPQKTKQFLTALQLFHCQGKTMGEIAAIVGLQAQYQVTRLLKLKSFRADVRHRLLEMLRDRILAAAKSYISPAQLQQQDKQIEEALSEQINTVIQEAEIEASTAKKTTTSSIFSQKLCIYLDKMI